MGLTPIFSGLSVRTKNIGLTLAILLQKAGVQYDIFERGLEARTVGK